MDAVWSTSGVPAGLQLAHAWLAAHRSGQLRDDIVAADFEVDGVVGDSPLRALPTPLPEAGLQDVPLVLQVLDARDVSRPIAHVADTAVAPHRALKCLATDGFRRVAVVEVSVCPGITALAPGAKLQLLQWRSVAGAVVMVPGQVRCLGGALPRLVAEFEAKQALVQRILAGRPTRTTAPKLASEPRSSPGRVSTLERPAAPKLLGYAACVAMPLTVVGGDRFSMPVVFVDGVVAGVVDVGHNWLANVVPVAASEWDGATAVDHTEAAVAVGAAISAQGPVFVGLAEPAARVGCAQACAATADDAHWLASTLAAVEEHLGL